MFQGVDSGTLGRYCVCVPQFAPPSGTLNLKDIMTNPTIASLCIDAVSAFGPMPVTALLRECMRETDKPEAEVLGAVIEWTERLGVELDEWGAYYLPGAGGML